MPADAAVVGAKRQAVSAHDQAVLGVDELQVEKGFVGPIVQQLLCLSGGILFPLVEGSCASFNSSSAALDAVELHGPVLSPRHWRPARHRHDPTAQPVVGIDKNLHRASG